MRRFRIQLLNKRYSVGVPLLFHADGREIRECIVVLGKYGSSALQQLLGLDESAGGRLQMAHLRENPRLIFGFGRRSRFIRHLHQFQRTVNVPKQLTKVSGAREPRQITGSKIEHPLHCSFRVRIVAQFSIGVSEKTIDEDVVTDLLIESFSGFEGGREFVAAEEEPYVDLLAFQIARREVNG